MSKYRRERLLVTEADIAKLPRWAQEHIVKLERQREAAVNALNRIVDQQTPSEIWYEESPCTGEASGPSFKRAYVQSSQVHFEHAGVSLRVAIHKDDCILLQWNGGSRASMDEVAFVPEAFQQARLMAKQHMR